MILLDVNILIYAVNHDAPLHRKAKTWLEAALKSKETAGISWNVLLAFLRVTTRAGLFRNPLPVSVAFDLIDSWLVQPSVVLVQPGPRHARILRDLLTTAGTGGNLTSDAHLAALAMEHEAELCSSDGDFARFPRLRWRNPLM
jgi:toxin-antitoxin system PIN domain toxin